MKRYYASNGWTEDYNDAGAFSLEQAAAILLNAPSCVDDNGTMTVLSPDAGRPGLWIIIRVMDPDLV